MSIARATALSVAATTLTQLPIALLGALAILISVDRSLSTVQLGFVVAVFYATSTVSSLPAGWVSERLGPVRTIELSAMVTAIVLISVAVLPWAYPELLLLCAMAGAANAGTQVAVNHLLATRIVQHRQGVVFGVKQASVPAGSLLAGLAVPVVGLTVGWPWAFAIAAGFALIVVLAAESSRTSPRAVRASQDRSVGHHMPALALLSVAVALASAAGNTLAPFLVSSAVARGITASDAGAVLAVGGLAAVVARVIAGWAADHRAREDALTMVAALLGIAVVGFALLATAASPAWFAVGVVIAFATGWGWNGLLWLTVARLQDVPAAAGMSLLQVGASGGGVLGPAAFGLLASNGSYGLAWAAAGGAALAATVLTVVARHLLLPQLRLRVVS